MDDINTTSRVTNSTSTTATTAATVCFNVGGTHYQVSRSLLDRFPHTLLAKMASSTWNHSSDGSQQALFVEGHGGRFQYVLDWMRRGSVVLPLNISKQALLQDLDYYGFHLASTLIESSIHYEPTSTPLHMARHLRQLQDDYQQNKQQQKQQQQEKDDDDNKTTSWLSSLSSLPQQLQLRRQPQPQPQPPNRTFLDSNADQIKWQRHYTRLCQDLAFQALQYFVQTGLLTRCEEYYRFGDDHNAFYLTCRQVAQPIGCEVINGPNYVQEQSTRLREMFLNRTPATTSTTMSEDDPVPDENVNPNPHQLQQQQQLEQQLQLHHQQRHLQAVEILDACLRVYGMEWIQFCEVDSRCGMPPFVTVHLAAL